MNINDIDSIIHLLQSISLFGIPFLILIILPLYIIGWSAIFKLLKINIRNSTILVITICISFILSLILLKIGVNKDKKLIIQASLLKGIILQNYSDFITFDELKREHHILIPNDSDYFDNLIERFPESFEYTWAGRDKGIRLIDSLSIKKLNYNINNLIPVIYSEFHDWKADSSMPFWELQDTVDFRMSYAVIEKLIVKYPEEFMEISFKKGDDWYEKLKKVK